MAASLNGMGAAVFQTVGTLGPAPALVANPRRQSPRAAAEGRSEK